MFPQILEAHHLLCRFEALAELQKRMPEKVGFSGRPRRPRKAQIKGKGELHRPMSPNCGSGSWDGCGQPHGSGMFRRSGQMFAWSIVVNHGQYMSIWRTMVNMSMNMISHDSRWETTQRTLPPQAGPRISKQCQVG